MDERQEPPGNYRVEELEQILMSAFRRYGIEDGSHLSPFGVVQREVERAREERGLDLTYEQALIRLLKRDGVPSDVKVQIGIIWGELYGAGEDLSLFRSRLGPPK